tara:strand:- start:3842 stop:4444 length:603 start_codon:yes stop_codon:yes gene_type:complete
MSLKFATVDNDAVEILNNKVVGSNSRFDGKEIKTNKDINEVFGIKPKVNMADYMKFGDSGEQQLYLDAIKVFRGEIKGPRAMQIMNAVEGEFGPGIMDKIRQDALKGSPTMQNIFPELMNMQKSELQKRGPKGTFRDFYPGDQMPQFTPENMPRTPNAIPPVFRPGDGQNYNNMQRNMNTVTGPKQLNRMLMANMMGLLS